MNVVLILGVAVGLSAPNLKDSTKKDTAIVGEWVPESMTMGGKMNLKPPAGMRYEFTADGQWISRREGAAAKGVPRDYKLDPKANPPTIDVAPIATAPAGVAVAAAQPMLGIYKLEGDTLTICFGVNGEERPKTFESPEGSRVMMMVLKRVKKKE